MLSEIYQRRPLILGHRGALQIAPENTLASFREAMRLGADGVELDTKLSRDGVVVALHDRTVDRTTDGAGRVWDLSLADLKSLDAGAKFDSKFTGERVPTLDEVFEALSLDAILNIELTNYGTVGDALPAKVAEVVRRHNAERRVFFSSFHPFTLMAARRACSVPLGMLFGVWNPLRLPNQWLASFTPHDLLHPWAELLTAQMVERAHRRGKPVNCWVSRNARETETQLTEWMDYAVDGLITNSPDLARKIADGRRGAHA